MKLSKSKFLFTGDDRDRTGDLWLAKPPLSQLSYIPVNSMGLSGVEPLTSRLSGARSNQLSYRPKLEPQLWPKKFITIVSQSRRIILQQWST